MFMKPGNFCEYYFPEHAGLALNFFMMKNDAKSRLDVIENRLPRNFIFLENRKNQLKLQSLLRAISSDCEYEIWRNIIWAIESLNWMSSYEFQYMWSAAYPHRFNQQALDKLISSYKPGYFSLGTIIMYAKKNGWTEEGWETEYQNLKQPDDEYTNPCSNFTILLGDLDEELGRNKLQIKNNSDTCSADISLKTEKHDICEDAVENLKLYTPEQLNTLLPNEYIIKNLLYKNCISSVYGPSMSGKSFLVIDMLACIATGTEWNGHRVKSVPITYLALEGASGISNRISAWCQDHGITSLPNFKAMIDNIDLTDSIQLNNLISSVISHNQINGIVVIDTLNQSAPDIDENSSKDMGRVLRALKKLQKATNCHVLIVHHTGKDPSKGLRGHSSLLAALDSTIEIRKDLSGRSWQLTKSKDGKADLQGFFELKIIDLGIDNDDEKITSCVVNTNPSKNKAIYKKAEPKGPHQKIALTVINELFQRISSSETRKIAINDAISAVGNRLVVDNKRRSERARAAINALVAMGIFCLSNDHLIE